MAQVGHTHGTRMAQSDVATASMHVCKYDTDEVVGEAYAASMQTPVMTAVVNTAALEKGRAPKQQSENAVIHTAAWWWW